MDRRQTFSLRGLKSKQVQDFKCFGSMVQEKKIAAVAQVIIMLPYLCTYIKNMYSVLIVFILYCKTLLLPLRWDTGEVRDRFGGMGRFKGGLICKGWVNIVIINVIT